MGSEILCFTTFVFLVTSVADHDRPFCTIQALKNVAPAEQIRIPDFSHFENGFREVRFNKLDRPGASKLSALPYKSQIQLFQPARPASQARPASLPFNVKSVHGRPEARNGPKLPPDARFHKVVGSSVKA